MVVHQDWRYRDFVTLIAMVEHLVHAYGDAQYFDAAEELACDRRSFNSVAFSVSTLHNTMPFSIRMPVYFSINCDDVFII